MYEEIACPEDFAKDLADLGGYNYFGEPLFRLLWQQNQTRTIPSPEGPWYIEEWAGFRDPIWILQKWMPPEAYGSPEMYYWAESFFERPLCGPYPEFGRYETIAKFKTVTHDSANRKLDIQTLPLNWDTLQGLTAILINAAEMTQWEVAAARQAEKELKDRRQVEEMADRLCDALPTFYGPVDYAGLRNRTALIDRESEKIEKQWNRMGLNRKKLPRGFFQKN